MRSSLVLLQISLSFVLLVGAGLLVKSLQGMRVASPGFSTQNVLISALDLNSAGYDAPRRVAFRDELLNRVEAIPGVQSAAFVRIAPFSYRSYSSAPIVIEGYQAGADEQPAPDYDEVSPGYFATLGIPLTSGRDFTRTDDDSSPPVAIVNEAMAAKYWPGANPLGRGFQLKGRRVEVVGVASMARYGSLLEPVKPFYYVPVRQNPAGLVVLCLRTSSGRGPVAAALASTVHALDPGLAPAEVITMREQVDRQSGVQTVALSLVSVFGAMALLLAVIGLFGVMSYVVSQRTHELGLRMALGARSANVVWLVLSSGMTLAVSGIVLGTGAALGTTRLLGNLLYQVSPRDPLAFGSAIVVVAVTTFAACLLPAWRASRTDPVLALRSRLRRLIRLPSTAARSSAARFGPAAAGNP
jgi:predicted permease